MRTERTLLVREGAFLNTDTATHSRVLDHFRTTSKRVLLVSGQDVYYLEYEMHDSNRVILRFESENDRDGCHISLDMYKAQLGPVDAGVLERIALKFRGQVVTPS